MTVSKHLAKHLREVYLGKNWTASNLKDQLFDLSWEEINYQYEDYNTILQLVYHIHYYVLSVTQVLQGDALESKDELSFNHPPIRSQEEWINYRENLWVEIESFAQLIEQLPNETFDEDFVDEKYGCYFRNLFGILEHTHYHLGQIALIKKGIRRLSGDLSA